MEWRVEKEITTRNTEIMIETMTALTEIDWNDWIYIYNNDWYDWSSDWNY